MLSPLFQIEPLENPIESGALILVPNKRLSQQIRLAWGSRCQQRGLSVWQAPKILTPEIWLDSLWWELTDIGHPALNGRRLLTSPQERCLWEQVLKETEQTSGQILPLSFANILRQASTRALQWQLTDREIATDHVPFDAWNQQFEAKLHQFGFISLPELAALAHQAFADGTLPREQAIALFGFQTLPPLYQTLAEAGAQQCRSISRDDSPPNEAAKPPHCFEAHNREKELFSAAAWVKERTSGNHAPRIGVVIPDLEPNRQQVERIFRQVLEPGFDRPDKTHSTPTFNISAGTPLSETPLIATALILLSLNRKQNHWQLYERLLCSPFWGIAVQEEADDGKQLAACANAIELLRNRGPVNPTPAVFRHIVGQSEQHFSDEREDASQATSGRLAAFESSRRQAPKRNRLSAWLHFFSDQLRALGWPGERTLDSIEYQQLKRWESLLSESRQLDEMLGEISLEAALGQLNRIAGESIFQPESTDSPVQILGLLESAGLHFDHLWVTGIDDDTWPSPCQPNPLLPAKIQRQKHMPRACPDREREIATELIQQFSAAANEVIFSYSRFDGERELKPSPLIAGLEATDWKPENPVLPTPETLEHIDDSHGVALHLDNSQVRGGTALFRDQSACPFDAYAIHRLGAQPLDIPQPGLSAIDRGSLVHLCLETIWHRLKHSDALRALDDAALESLLDQAIDTAIQSIGRDRPELFGYRFKKLEILRLKGLLTDWLDLERSRRAFTVLETESRKTVTFADIPLKFTIDRVDEIDGKTFLIDYKTGTCAVNDWLGERPKQPQLPLYALSSESLPAAIGYGAVSNRIDIRGQSTLGFHWVGTKNGLPPDFVPSGGSRPRALPEDSETLIEQWRTALTQLAEELKSGFAAVSYRDNQTATWSSDWWPLNRWPELTHKDSAERGDSVE